MQDLCLCEHIVCLLCVCVLWMVCDCVCVLWLLCDCVCVVWLLCDCVCVVWLLCDGIFYTKHYTVSPPGSAWASQPLEPRPKVVGMLNLRLVNGFLPAGRPRCHLIIVMIVMIMLPRGVIMDLLNLQ